MSRSRRASACASDLGMRVRAEQPGAFRADGPIAERRAFGRAGDDTDMAGHAGRVHEASVGGRYFRRLSFLLSSIIGDLPRREVAHVAGSCDIDADAVGVRTMRVMRNPMVPSVTRKRSLEKKTPCRSGVRGRALCAARSQIPRVFPRLGAAPLQRSVKFKSPWKEKANGR